MTFIGLSVPINRKKFQSLVGALGMKPSQLLGIELKVYNAQKASEVEQATVLLETCREIRRGGILEERGEAP